MPCRAIGRTATDESSMVRARDTVISSDQQQGAMAELAHREIGVIDPLGGVSALDRRVEHRSSSSLLPHGTSY